MHSRLTYAVDAWPFFCGQGCRGRRAHITRDCHQGDHEDIQPVLGEALDGFRGHAYLEIGRRQESHYGERSHVVEQFIEASGKKLMIVLSYGERLVIDFIAGKPRFDQPIVDFLATRDYPVIDMRDAFAADFKHSTLDVENYLDKYFTSHHSPAGNFFTADVLLKSILQWVDPKPAPYLTRATGAAGAAGIVQA